MAPLHGVHRVRITLASGRAEYWYAWRGRGAPKILSESAVSDRVLDLKVAAAAEAAGRKYFELVKARKTPVAGTLGPLIRRWAGIEGELEGAPEFENLAYRTKKDLRRHLKVVEADLGALPLVALKSDGARKELIEWRNRYAETPRTADHYASALSQLLAWARDQGETSADPMREWPWIYRVDRSEIIWTAAEIETVCQAAEGEPELQRAILMAAYSGLRQSDLIALPWSSIDRAAGRITRRTKKRRRRVADVPLTPELLRVIDATPEVGPIVLTKDGAPWKASTLQKRWRLARATAIEILPSIEGKRWHDLRGAFATLLVRSGTPDDDLDRIMGWEPGKASLTRASYVNVNVVADLAIERLRRFTQAA